MWQSNPTQVTGLLAFGAAAVSSFLAGRKRVSERSRWKTLAIVYALMFAEVWFGWRHWLTQDLRGLVQGEGLYADRRPFQAIVIVAFLAILWLGVIGVAFRGRRQSGALNLSFGCVFIALSLFGLELISLHGTDGILYGFADGIRLIGWLWLATGGLATIAALATVLGRRGRR